MKALFLATDDTFSPPSGGGRERVLRLSLSPLQGHERIMGVPPSRPGLVLIDSQVTTSTYCRLGPLWAQWSVSRPVAGHCSSVCACASAHEGSVRHGQVGSLHGWGHFRCLHRTKMASWTGLGAVVVPGGKLEERRCGAARPSVHRVGAGEGLRAADARREEEPARYRCAAGAAGELDQPHARGGDCSCTLLVSVRVSLATSPTGRASTGWSVKHLEGAADAQLRAWWREHRAPSRTRGWKPGKPGAERAGAGSCLGEASLRSWGTWTLQAFP